MLVGKKESLISLPTPTALSVLEESVNQIVSTFMVKSFKKRHRLFLFSSLTFCRKV